MYKCKDGFIPPVPTCSLISHLSIFQMRPTTPHPAVHRLRSTHADSVSRLRTNFRTCYTPPAPCAPTWSPKNPEVTWPPMEQERAMTQSEWEQTGFPHHPLPTEVKGVVNVEVWYQKIEQLLAGAEAPHGLIRIMQDIAQQLSHGASSHVGSPGSDLTQGHNVLHNPSEELPRVVDALASFTRNGHMAGPLFNLPRSQFKTNPLMAVTKPGGHVRVVSNLKSPPGQSFNEGINSERLKDWPVTQLTAAQFGKKIFAAGQHAYMACSDLKDAYKMLPVEECQRKLQAYFFCGALFIELKLVFGDRMACQYFDRFHHAILHAFVYPESSFPPIAQGKTVDDIPSVVPQDAKHALDSFVKAYRSSLTLLNIQAAEDDPSRTKAFDCAQEGEVLGIRFDTSTFTWALPKDKLYYLVTGLRRLGDIRTRHSLRELESVTGKAIYLTQLCPPLKTLLGEVMFMMTEHVHYLSDDKGEISDKKRDAKIFYTSPDASHDMMMLAALLADTHDNPLPIIDTDLTPPLCAVLIYPDASGNIAGTTSPCLGVFFPPQDHRHAAAHSLPFPTDFLLQSNGSALVADTSSTLEALGLIIPMMIEPHRCVGKALHFNIDNFAVVCSAQKRRSRDRLAHTLIRAAYLVSGALACKIFVSWRQRRSDPPSVVADDLTHMDFRSATSLDQYVNTSTHQYFPEPISRWMRNPCFDRDLGHKIIEWMSRTYDNLL